MHLEFADLLDDEHSGPEADNVKEIFEMVLHIPTQPQVQSLKR